MFKAYSVSFVKLTAPLFPTGEHLGLVVAISLAATPYTFFSKQNQAIKTYGAAAVTFEGGV
jgi:hypothetical protein